MTYYPTEKMRAALRCLTPVSPGLSDADRVNNALWEVGVLVRGGHLPRSARPLDVQDALTRLTDIVHSGRKLSDEAEIGQAASDILTVFEQFLAEYWQMVTRQQGTLPDA